MPNEALGNRHAARRCGIHWMQPMSFDILDVSWIPRRSAEWRLPSASFENDYLLKIAQKASDTFADEPNTRPIVM